MKKISIIILTVFAFVSFVPKQMRAETEPNPKSLPETKSHGSIQANVLLTRLYAINDMNKSSLSTAEKRELRKEVKGIKSTLKALDGGVYLSVGAIIIILLILILLI